jgi:hypothetical protein
MQPWSAVSDADGRDVVGATAGAGRVVPRLLAWSSTLLAAHAPSMHEARANCLYVLPTRRHRAAAQNEGDLRTQHRLAGRDTANTP